MKKNYQLPEAVEKHFIATNEENSTAFLSTFHDDAVVFDAGKEYHGKAVPLPQPIATYYHACDGYDKNLLSSCFTDNAVLYDEGKEYYGPTAICEHIMKANQDARVTKKIIRCTEQNDRSFVVTAMLTGEFEGSPLPLDYRFTLDGVKINALNITLAEE